MFIIWVLVLLCSAFANPTSDLATITVTHCPSEEAIGQAMQEQYWRRRQYETLLTTTRNLDRQRKIRSAIFSVQATEYGLCLCYQGYWDVAVASYEKELATRDVTSDAPRIVAQPSILLSSRPECIPPSSPTVSGEEGRKVTYDALPLCDTPEAERRRVCEDTE